jgi:hypothetical protein
MENNNLKERVDEIDRRTIRIGEEVRVISVQVREAHRGFVEVFAEFKNMQRDQTRTDERVGRVENRIDARLTGVEDTVREILNKLITSQRWSLGLVGTGISIILVVLGLIL